MKNIFYCLFVCLLITSCMEDDPLTYPVESITDETAEGEILLLNTTTKDFSYDGSALSGSQELPLVVALGAAPKSSDLSYQFDTEDGTAVSGVHYDVSSNTGVIPAGSLKSFAPITVNLDEMTVGEVYTFSLWLTDADGVSFNKSKVDYSISKICPSNIGGEFDAVVTLTSQDAGTDWDDCSESTWEGKVRLEKIADTEYTVFSSNPGGDGFWNDPSFGAYYPCYMSAAEANLANGDQGSAGDVRLREFCGKLSFLGTSQWDEVYSITDVIVEGSKLTFNWTNDYGEGAKVELTRNDGQDWPELTN